MKTICTLLLTAVSLGGCADREEVFEQRFSLLPPVALDRSVAFVEQGTPTAYLLDVEGRGASMRTYELDPNPVFSGSRHAHDELLVLAQGERGRAGHAPAPASLTVLPGDRAGATRSYELGSPFNAIAQSDDGRYAIAYFQRSAGLERLLFNPNEIAVIDLDAEPSDTNPVLRTVRSFGGVPTKILFSPAMTIAGEAGRSLAVVLSGAYVTLLDLSYLDRSEITVRLTLPEDLREINPSQVLFDGAAATLYVRADSSDDIYVLTLNALPAAERVSNDFRPSLNQLAAGSRPRDMVLFDTGDGPRVLAVAAGSSEATIIEASSNRVTRIPLGVAADRILLYEGPAPHDQATKPRALLLGVESGATAVSFLDLELVEERRTRNVELLSLGRPVRALLPLPDRELVLLVHSALPGQHGITGLNLYDRTTSPIFAEVPLEGARFGPAASRLWVAPTSGNRLGWLDLETFHPGELRLDAPVSDVIPLRGEIAGGHRIVALHPGEYGAATVIDAEDPQRETAVTFVGVGLSGLLQRGER